MSNDSAIRMSVMRWSKRQRHLSYPREKPPNEEFRVSAAGAEVAQKFSMRGQLVYAGVEDSVEIRVRRTPLSNICRPTALPVNALQRFPLRSCSPVSRSPRARGHQAENVGCRSRLPARVTKAKGNTVLIRVQLTSPSPREVPAVYLAALIA